MAKATVIEERDRILADIAADAGVQKMTHELKDALFNSVSSPRSLLMMTIIHGMKSWDMNYAIARLGRYVSHIRMFL